MNGAERTPFYYQSTADGATGFGTETHRDERSFVAEQQFMWPDGSTRRQRHRTEFVGADTHITESAVWSEGRWEPGRRYTWKRMPAAEAPCGPRAERS